MWRLRQAPCVLDLLANPTMLQLAGGKCMMCVRCGTTMTLQEVVYAYREDVGLVANYTHICPHSIIHSGERLDIE
jgi:hypothetical protein